MITVEELTKTFHTGRGARRRSAVAVHDISFVIEPGERVAYIWTRG